MENNMTRVANKEIYDEVTELKVGMAELGGVVEANCSAVNEIKNNHLVHIQKDIKDIITKVGALDKNQAVLMARMALVVTIAIVAGELVLRYVLKV